MHRRRKTLLHCFSPEEASSIILRPVNQWFKAGTGRDRRSGTDGRTEYEKRSYATLRSCIKSKICIPSEPLSHSSAIPLHVHYSEKLQPKLALESHRWYEHTVESFPGKCSRVCSRTTCGKFCCRSAPLSSSSNVPPCMCTNIHQYGQRSERISRYTEQQTSALMRRREQSPKLLPFTRTRKISDDVIHASVRLTNEHASAYARKHVRTQAMLTLQCNVGMIRNHVQIKDYEQVLHG